jgi:transcriptional regulator with XRE-family HTH domain
MDAVRFGRGIRALRRRRGWRQVDLAHVAGLSRTVIARVELGQADRVTVRTVESIAAALGARLDIRLSWNGEALDRLLDSSHAQLVDRMLSKLHGWGWHTSPEVSFNIYGERGSVDILGVHARTGALLVVEVKSVVPDIQAMLVALDRKARLAPRIHGEQSSTDATARAGHPTGTAARASKLLVIGNDRTSRRRLAAFDATFEAAFPTRGYRVDAWLRAPDPTHPIAGIRFVSGVPQANTRHRMTRSGNRERPERPETGDKRSRLGTLDTGPGPVGAAPGR